MFAKQKPFHSLDPFLAYSVVDKFLYKLFYWIYVPYFVEIVIYDPVQPGFLHCWILNQIPMIFYMRSN